MAVRRPLVIVNGRKQELPVGDTLPGGGGSGSTNLGIANRTTTTLDVTSDSGTDATVPQASITEAGLMTAVDKSKLDGIEDGADVTDSANVDAAGAVMESDYTPAHSVLVQQNGTGSPSIVQIQNNEILGRDTGSGADIEGLSAAQVRTIINVEDGATADQLASEVPVTPSGNLTSTDVQTGLEELQGDIDSNAANLTAHLNDTVDAHDASAISFVNTTSGLAATEVQSAIDEVEGRLDAAETNISTNDADILNLQQTVGASTEATVNYSSNNYVTDGEDTITAIGDLDTQVKINEDGLAAHISDPIDAHDASAISYINSTSGLVAIEVQAAIDELKSLIEADFSKQFLTMGG